MVGGCATSAVPSAVIVPAAAATMRAANCVSRNSSAATHSAVCSKWLVSTRAPPAVSRCGAGQLGDLEQRMALPRRLHSVATDAQALAACVTRPVRSLSPRTAVVPAQQQLSQKTRSTRGRQRLATLQLPSTAHQCAARGGSSMLCARCSGAPAERRRKRARYRWDDGRANISYNSTQHILTYI